LCEVRWVSASIFDYKMKSNYIVTTALLDTKGDFGSVHHQIVTHKLSHTE